MTSRRITPDELFPGSKVTLRLITLADCSERYVSWLSDPLVNRYLETRWSAHSLETVRAFVSDMIDSPDNYLFAILRRSDSEHVGNIKIGPIQPHHSWANVG
jgi:RimJ/RimL family protein N-acetyltransferase